MMEKHKACPLLCAAYVSGLTRFSAIPKEGRRVTIECSYDKCAWYDGERECCAVLTLTGKQEAR